MNTNNLEAIFNDNSYALLLNGNGHAKGFNNRVLYSNNHNQNNNPNQHKICFINYDYKSAFEKFTQKTNNPLQFSEKLIINCENELRFNQLKWQVNNRDNTAQKIIIKPTVSKQEYINTVNKLKHHIQQGNIYEINYCITFEAHDAIINPVNLYQKLNNISNAPYSALAKFNHHYIICSSPELYINKKGNQLFSKPIKGTAKRGATNNEDILIKDELKNSLKERTENVMIVDVVRNDFSRIATKGSVKVEELFKIETYEQVHQMVSTISCQLKENIGFENILEATFPMASMTGAPKIRAMQLIDEYEIYNRSAYSGALGYIDENNDFELNVLIRSIFYDEKKQYLSFSVGSAITALCNAEDEYEECLLKAQAMFSVVA